MYLTIMKDKSRELLEMYIKEEIPNKIKFSEFIQAMKEVADTKYNTVEFGVNGYYTIPYYDENII